MKFTSSIRNTGFGLVILIIMAGCGSEHENGNSHDIESAPRASIDSLNLFAGPATHKTISRPTAIEVLPNAKIAALDVKLNKVLLFNPDGSLDHTFGRRGKGPGEFVAPRALQVRGSTINVIDVALQRVNQFNLDGTFIRNYPLEREAPHFGFVATGDSMEYYTVANGLNGKLVGHHNAATDKTRYFGEAVVKNPPPTTDKQAFLNSAANGKVPAAIRNDLTMDFQEGMLYVFLKSMSRLQKYEDGKMMWDKKLDHPVNDAIFTNFAEDVQSGSSAFGVLRYIEDLTATSDNVYLLWNGTKKDPQTIVKIDTEGKVKEVIELPSSGNHKYISLSVDNNDKRLFLTEPGTARIYSLQFN